MAKPAIKGDIRDTRLSDALGERYLAYALSTIKSRSLPDVRDGLKPVHRRLLFAMRQLKLDPKTGYKKCARVIGDVIGKYHPHGDGAVYDTLVRLAQEFAVRYPLVDGQGNFGNIDGDNAAAMRYTEARMTAVAAALLEGIDEDTVDFRDTYDGEDEEPIVLPSRFPNLLANGCAGIAVGMATNIPPHNAGELCDALAHLIRHPNASFEKIVDFIPGPDFPTGGILVENSESITQAYRTGRGGFRLRARWEAEDLGRGTFQIVITEIPYQVQKSRLIEKIADLISSKKLPLLVDVRDESTTEVRIVLEPRSRTIEASVLMEHLFKLSDLEVRISLNMNVLDGGTVPGVMNIRQVLQAFLDHRHDVLLRKSHHRLKKIEHRLEILGGLLIAYLNLDEVIRIIRTQEKPKQALMEMFQLTDVQAEAILNMRLRQLHKLEEIVIQKENDALSQEASEIEALLNNEDSRWKVITDEVHDIRKQFGKKTELGKRRTTIGDVPTADIVSLDTLIEKEPITIVASEKGWIRSIKGHVEDSTTIKYKDGDRGRFIIRAETTDKLVLFSTNGRFYTVGCDKLPGGRGHGEPIRLMIDMPSGHDLVSLFVHQPDRRLMIASDRGRGFIALEKDVVAQTRSGRQVLNLNADEEASVCSFVTDGHDAMAVVGENRKLLIFSISELPVMGRGKGVILQRYAKGGLKDVTSVLLSEGLKWHTGAGTRCEKNITPWIGKRGQSGQLTPKGFPRSNQFGSLPGKGN